MTLADEVEALCPCKTPGYECGPHGCDGGCKCEGVSMFPACSWPGHDLARRVGEMEKQLKDEKADRLSRTIGAMGL